MSTEQGLSTLLCRQGQALSKEFLDLERKKWAVQNPDQPALTDGELREVIRLRWQVNVDALFRVAEPDRFHGEVFATYHNTDDWDLLVRREAPPPFCPLFVQSQGGEVVRTNYWQSSYAQHGLFYLTVNGGVFRLLVPEDHLPSVAEMATAKTVVVSRGQYRGVDNCLEILFDDNSQRPFQITINPKQIDLLPSQENCGKPWKLDVYTAGCKKVLSFVCYTRLVDTLPCLKPYKRLRWSERS